jgi:hypothetical protein
MYNYYNYNDFAIIVHYLQKKFELLEFFYDWKTNNSLCTKYNLHITWIQSIYITHIIYTHVHYNILSHMNA